MKSLLALLLVGMVTMNFAVVVASERQNEKKTSQKDPKEIGTFVEKASQKRFDPDNEPDAVHYYELADRFGPIPTPQKKNRIAEDSQSHS